MNPNSRAGSHCSEDIHTIIARLRAATLPRPAVHLLCDEYEKLLASKSNNTPARETNNATEANTVSFTGFDRRSYQRNYMRPLPRAPQTERT